MASPNLVLHLVSPIRQSLRLSFAYIHMFRKCRHFLSRCAQDEQISDPLSNISASFNYKQKHRILKYTCDNHKQVVTHYTYYKNWSLPKILPQGTVPQVSQERLGPLVN